MKATANNNNENQVIYNEIAKVARRAFEFIEIEPGQYTVSQILAALKKCDAHWNDRAPEFYTLEDAATVAVGSFSCQFLKKDAFRILAKVGAAWNIPTAGRATFEREKEDAATVIAFNVPAAAAAICKAIDKKDSRESMRYVYIDAKRRAAVASDGRLLTVAAVPSLSTTDTDRAGFMIHPSIFKAGRVAIDANNKASNGNKVADSPVLRYPNWAGVFPAVYDTDAITFDKKAAAALKKAVAAATKQAEQIYSNGEVIQAVAIYGEANTNKITVRSRQKENILINNEWIEKTTYSDHNVTTADTLQRSFCWVLNGIRFASLPTFEKIYLPGNGRAAVIVGKNAVSLLMPVAMPEDWQNPTNANYNNYTRPNYAQPVNVIDDLLNVPAAPVVIDDTTESDTAAAESDTTESDTAAAVESDTAAAVAIDDTTESTTTADESDTTESDTTTAAAAVAILNDANDTDESDTPTAAAVEIDTAAAAVAIDDTTESTTAANESDTTESDTTTAAAVAILNDANDTGESDTAAAAVVSFWQYAARVAAAVVLLIIIVAGRSLDTANNSDTAAGIGNFKAITTTKAAKVADTTTTTTKAAHNATKAVHNATKAAKVADTTTTTTKAAHDTQKAAQNESDTAAAAAVEIDTAAAAAVAILNDASDNNESDTAAAAAIDTDDESDTAAILNDANDTDNDNSTTDTDTAESNGTTGNDAPTTAPTTAAAAAGPALGLSAAACVFFPII